MTNCMTITLDNHGHPGAAVDLHDNEMYGSTWCFSAAKCLGAKGSQDQILSVRPARKSP